MNGSASTAVPKVSVLMLAYNHEPFIAQALDSALAQKTDFPFEIVVGEDHSTDRTAAIIQECQLRFPEQVRLLSRPTNIGMMRNFVETYQACRGKYVALLEGDDYWTDTTKLQQQVGFLDDNPDYAICFHDVLVVGRHGRDEPWRACSLFKKKESGLKQLIHGNYIPTCSAVVRNGLLQEFPGWLMSLGLGDWPFLLLIAQHGKIRYLDRVMAHYRMGNGVWSGDLPIRNTHKLIAACEALNAGLDFRFNPAFRCGIFWCWCDLAVKYAECGSAAEALRFRRLAIRFSWQHLPTVLLTGWMPMKLRFKTLARLYSPGLYSRVRHLTGKTAGGS
jgi:glycosyltransferase involved in cell wall biosynthesis